MSDTPWTTDFKITEAGVPGAVARPVRTPEMLVMNYERIRMLRSQGVKSFTPEQIDGLLELIAADRANP